MADYGLNLVFVSHWDNKDGGAQLDTSRCYIGQDRFARLQAQIPGDLRVVGIDEKTALGIDFVRQRCRVIGAGEVTLLDGTRTEQFRHGHEFDLALLGEYRRPEAGSGVAPAVWAEALDRAAAPKVAEVVRVPAEVQALVARRDAARSTRDWVESDRLRAAISDLGWQVQDTPSGTEVSPMP